MFCSECLWIVFRTLLRANDMAQIQQGQLWLTNRSTEEARSVLAPVLAALCVGGDGPDISEDRRPAPGVFVPYPRSWRWRARMPFILIGVLLGSSLWYVARRLFGNAGGFIALALYVF